MEGKLYVLIAYMLIGLTIALWPIFLQEKVTSHLSIQFHANQETRNRWFWQFMCFSIAVICIILLPEKSTQSFSLNLGIITLTLSLTNKEFDLFNLMTTFFVFCISTTLLFWRKQGALLNVNNYELLTFLFLTFSFHYIFRIKKPTKEYSFSLKWFIPYIFLASILSFSTGIFHNAFTFKTLWMHWGAYIAPAELLLSGATIFHDFPAQYGLGPTALIASVCGSDCWYGMYFIASFTMLVFSILIGILAFALTRKSWPEQVIALVLSLVTSFFWTSYPPLAGSPVASPSIHGLRFLPILFLVTYLFVTKNVENSKLKLIIAHCFWIFGALWSPESAFYVTCVWWPYYMFIRSVPGKLSARCFRLLQSLLTLSFIGAALIVTFNILFRFIYHKYPSLDGFLVHILYPPLPLPIDPYGPIWYFVLTIIIGVSTLILLWRKSGDTYLFRSGFLVILLSYTVFSQFLGRSHSDVVLNTLPFFLLVLLHAILATDNRKLDHIIKKASVICIAAMLGWLPAFGWDGWNNNVSNGRVFSFDPNIFRHSIPSLNAKMKSKKDQNILNPEANIVLPTDALQAINFIQHSYNEPFTVVNKNFDLVDVAPTEAWNAMHGPANYLVIPSQYKRKFLNLTAAAIHRPGWLIIDKTFPAKELLSDIDFDFVYERTKQLEFGSYYAIRFNPKTQSKLSKQLGSTYTDKLKNV